ncbi:SDR family oxidoreductase [Rhizobium sp. PAMB 3182]
MRVFVTGASGFVGSAVVGELIAAGHKVAGLARSEKAAKAISAMGAEVIRGDLTDLASLKHGAQNADGIIHTGFVHDFSRFKECCEIDVRAIETMGSVLAGSERLMLVTSATGILPSGAQATEKTVASSAIPRMSEQTAFALQESGVRASAVRLAPSVHGVGDHGFVPLLINLARDKGAAAYVGAGDNVWPGVHRLDAARLYRLALENGTSGVAYHATAEPGVPFRKITEVIGRRLGLPVVSKSGQDAVDHFGWFAHFAELDNPSSSEWTRQTLGWQPTGPDLLADLDQPAYFEG